MVRYGIYTVKELERFAKGLKPKRNINILSECTKCDFVYEGDMCLNCQNPWNTVRWRVTCPRDLSSSATIICVQKGNWYAYFTENVWERVTNHISLQNGFIGSMVTWLSNAEIFTAMQYPCHASYVENPWRDWVYVGQLMMVHNGSIAKSRNIFRLLYQRLNRKEF